MKVALVTGAAAGIGAAIARRLAREGIAIGVLDILFDDAIEVANEIVAGGGKAIPLQASIADRSRAIMALTRTLAQELGPCGITCNNIPPRFVTNTRMSDYSFSLPEMRERLEPITQAGPIRRQGTPEDIAGSCAWLVSDEAGYVTGQTIGSMAVAISECRDQEVVWYWFRQVGSDRPKRSRTSQESLP